MSPGPGPTGDRELFAHRDYALFSVGSLVNTAGSSAQLMTQAWLMFALTGSTFLVGAVNFAATYPPFLLALVGGELVDRVERRRLLVGACVAGFVVAGALSVYALTRQDHTDSALLLASAVLLGTTTGLALPAGQALIEVLVPRRLLGRALARQSRDANIGRALGAALAATLIVRWGAWAAFGANALSFVLMGAMLIWLHSGTRAESAPRQGSTMARVLEGWRYLARNRILQAQVAISLVLAWAADPVLTLTPALAGRMLNQTVGLPESAYGMGTLVAAFSVGGVVMSLVLTRLRRRAPARRVAVFGLCLLALGVATSGRAPSVAAAAAALAIAGAGFLSASTCLLLWIQEQSPRHFLERIMSIWGIGFATSRPLAALFDGWIASRYGTAVTTLLIGVVVLFAATLVFLLPTSAHAEGDSPPDRQRRVPQNVADPA
ncbi:MAG: MFS transporter [Candidatus Dormibacteria bacterium]